MATTAPVILRLVASSVCVARRAGSIIRDVMKKGELGIVEKAKNDLQTEADRSAQRCIIASLHQQFPKVSIFGEEELDNEPLQPDFIEANLDSAVMKSSLPDALKNVKDEDIVVWVDPLDGTSEYTQGLLDHVTVLIGIAVKGKSVAGVIYQPFYNYQSESEAKLGRCIWGIIGLGSFGTYTRRKLLEKQNIIATSKAHWNDIVRRAVDECRPTEVLRVGGAGSKVLLLIEGKANAYVFASPGCKKWDTCAPEAVLHAAGGRLTDMHGTLYEYHPSVQRRNAGGVLATARAEDHQWYAERIPDSVLAALPTGKL